jgi:sugar-specific transcriptional regulator TrmB
LKNLKLVKHREAPLFWVVRGDWTIKTKIQKLIDEAKNEITIGCPKTSILHEISGMLVGLNKKIRCLLMQKG